MKRDYIDVQDALRALSDRLFELNEVYSEEKPGLISAKRIISNLSEGDSIAAKYRWTTYVMDGPMGHRGTTFKCERCDFIYPVKTSFCPNCGADLREEES